MKISILIVDDDPDKIDAIRDTVLSAEDEAQIDVAKSVNEAKKLLRLNAFDLLILDLVLPISSNAPNLSSTGGLSLLEWLETDGLRPGYIIGMSGFQDIAQQQAASFSQHAWVVLRYEYSDIGWKDQLTALLKHIVDSRRHASTLKYESDLLVVTALRSPELEQFLALGWRFDSVLRPIDGRQFVRRGTKPLPSGDELLVYAGSTSKMGMVWTSLFVANAIRQLRPRVVAMTGICMGHPKETKLGDIVVALHTWNWQAGRLSASKDGSAFFEAQPEPVVASKSLSNLWDDLAADLSVAQRIYDEYQGIKPDGPPKIKVAPMVSGSVVIAHEVVHKDIFSQDRKIRAVDMETFGVYAGCDTEEALPPLFFSIKSVSDLGLPEKDDRFQKYCAYASAKAVEIFFDRFWLANIMPLFRN